MLVGKQRADTWRFPRFSFYRIARGRHHGSNAFLTQHTKHKLVTYRQHRFKNTSTPREDRTAVAESSEAGAENTTLCRLPAGTKLSLQSLCLNPPKSTSHHLPVATVRGHRVLPMAGDTNSRKNVTG